MAITPAPPLIDQRTIMLRAVTPVVWRHLLVASMPPPRNAPTDTPAGVTFPPRMA